MRRPTKRPKRTRPVVSPTTLLTVRVTTLETRLAELEKRLADLESRDNRLGPVPFPPLDWPKLPPEEHLPWGDPNTIPCIPTVPMPAYPPLDPYRITCETKLVSTPVADAEVAKAQAVKDCINASANL